MRRGAQRNLLHTQRAPRAAGREKSIPCLISRLQRWKISHRNTPEPGHHTDHADKSAPGDAQRVSRGRQCGRDFGGARKWRMK